MLLFVLRRSLLLGASYQSGLLFEGGAGGLSKRKPDTGVRPTDRAIDASVGIFQSQLLTSEGLPIDISFTAPWKALNPLAARDLATGDSAFVVVAPTKDLSAATAKVFGTEGKFGAFGEPTDIRLLRREENNVFDFAFAALTPSMREVDRRVLVKAVTVDTDTFMLVAGATAQRWKVSEAQIRATIDSFRVNPAPDYDSAMRSYRKKQQRPS